MGFTIIGSLARHRRPPIRFLFIGSRLCSTLLSGPASRRVLFHPCASLNLRLHQVEGLHLLAAEHAWHTKKEAGHLGQPERLLCVAFSLRRVTY